MYKKDVVSVCYIRKYNNLSCRDCEHNIICEKMKEEYKIKYPYILEHDEIKEELKNGN